jgi:cell pole-organizing protein PopZ
MSKPAAKAPEPSMEEILASIRRIISDENNASAQPAAAPAPAAPAAAKPAAPPPAAKKIAPPPPPPPPPAAEEEEPDVLELTEMVETKTQDEPRPAEAAADVMFRDPEPVREPAPRYSPPPARLDEQLLSQHASSAVSAAFDRIAAPMFSGDSRTVDELVREMLRPMLKAWLDDNLPSLVERLVRAEIERVSRGR